jgi:hypothetical protein
MLEASEGGTVGGISGSESDPRDVRPHASAAGLHAGATGSHALAAELHAGAAGPHALAAELHAGPTGSHAPAAELHAGATGPHALAAELHAGPTGSHALAAELHAGPTGSHAPAARLHVGAAGPHAPAARLHAGATGSHAPARLHVRPTGSHARTAGLHAGDVGTHAAATERATRTLGSLARFGAAVATRRSLGPRGPVAALGSNFTGTSSFGRAVLSVGGGERRCGQQKAGGKKQGEWSHEFGSNPEEGAGSLGGKATGLSTSAGHPRRFTEFDVLLEREGTPQIADLQPIGDRPERKTV